MGAYGIEAAGEFWTITCYFNPLRSARRRDNYRTFRRHLRDPLLAVEWSGDGRFDLADGDADILIRIHGGDALWQKERLLNLALRALPSACRFIAWLDADIVFTDPDWPARVTEALRDFPLIQVFRRLVELGPDDEVESTVRNVNGSPSRQSLASGLIEGRFDLGVFERIGGSLARGYTPGHGWAARRSLFDGLELYDTLVLGSGDKAIAAAAYGQIEPFIASLGLDPAHAGHLRAWAEPVSRAIAGRVGFCENTILHLWHGDLARRQYGTRYRQFRQFRFDPSADLRLASSGAWRWGSAKAEMHRYVREYLVSRDEDGPA
jgi:hypothetical protein